MLAELIDRHGADCWLVNTGWSGGQYGVGQRMSIRHTRALLKAALDGSLARVKFRQEPYFGLSIPEAVPGIPSEVLDPRQSWADKAAYDRTAKELVARFEKNFASFEAGVGEAVKAIALRAAA
jgi:phosphoenolpyruvate carboxykinase (ATP)